MKRKKIDRTHFCIKSIKKYIYSNYMLMKIESTKIPKRFTLRSTKCLSYSLERLQKRLL